MSAFAIVSGIVLHAMELPASEIIIGAGIGYLFKTGVNQVKEILKK